ncbi:hypothetical protein ACWDG1_18060 [Streptomyces sp. NPDC001177]
MDRLSVPGTPGVGVRLDREQLLAAHDLYRQKALSDRDDSLAMQYLVKDWTFAGRRRCLVRPWTGLGPSGGAPWPVRVDNGGRADRDRTDDAPSSRS